MPSEEPMTSHNIERPCGHMQTVRVRPQQSLADYNFRVVPELREAMQKPCEQCENQKAELAKQKLVQEMQEKAKSK
jgi:hypothetical protein